MPLSVRLSKSFGFSLSKSSFYMKHLTAKCAYVHCFLHRVMCINFGIFRVLEVVYYLIFHVYLFLVLIWTSLPISIVLFVHMKCSFSMVIFGVFFHTVRKSFWSLCVGVWLSTINTLSHIHGIICEQPKMAHTYKHTQYISHANIMLNTNIIIVIVIQQPKCTEHILI